MSVLIKLRAVEKTTQGKTYKDVNIRGLIDSPSQTDIKAIRNRINNLFTWSQGTRILLPGFGNVLEKIKYEPLNDITMKNAESSIKQMFKYEPEVTLNTINFTPDHDKNQLGIRVEYSVPSLDIKTSVDFTVEVLGE